MVKPLWKTVMEVPQRNENRTTILSSNSTAHYIVKENENVSTCIPMFVAALFTIAKIWKQPKCPSTDEWIKNM